MKIRKVTKAELEAIEFASAQSCWHKCPNCGVVEPHKIPFGPMLPITICAVGNIWLTCLKCRKPPTKEELKSVQDKDIVRAIKEVERRFSVLKGKK